MRTGDDPGGIPGGPGGGGYSTQPQPGIPETNPRDRDIGGRDIRGPDPTGREMAGAGTAGATTEPGYPGAHEMDMTESRPPGPTSGQAPGSGLGADMASRESWAQRSRIVLTPVAPPSILGLFGFAGATFMVASLLAGWWGSPILSAPILAPFVFFFGGLAQLLAAMWSYRARDGVATAMHGTWGSFWLAWATLIAFITLGAIPPIALFSQAFGFWFIVLCVVTTFGALASLGDNLGMFAVLILLAAGSGLLAAGLIGAIGGVIVAGGWVLVASAAAAFYTAAAMMMANSFGGRTILPLGRYSAAGNIPGRQPTEPISYPAGMPGSKVGQ